MRKIGRAVFYQRKQQEQPAGGPQNPHDFVSPPRRLRDFPTFLVVSAGHAFVCASVFLDSGPAARLFSGLENQALLLTGKTPEEVFPTLHKLPVDA
jgi:hypothetical protein